MKKMKLLMLAIALCCTFGGCASTAELRGTGDLGLIIGRASGQVTVVNTSTREPLHRVSGLGDLSHAHITYSRDGGLTKVDLLRGRVVQRVLQAGNSIGGSISQDGRLIVAQNYDPGGIKVFDADTLQLLSEVSSEYAPGAYSKVVGLVDLPNQRFA